MAEQKRQSNIELLRIVAMFLILCNHLISHAVRIQLTDSSSIARMGAMPSTARPRR